MLFFKHTNMFTGGSMPLLFFSIKTVFFIELRLHKPRIHIMWEKFNCFKLTNE